MGICGPRHEKSFGRILGLLNNRRRSDGKGWANFSWVMLDKFSHHQLWGETRSPLAPVILITQHQQKLDKGDDVFRDISCSESLGPEAGCGLHNGSACSSPEPWRIKRHPAALTKLEQEWVGPGVSMHSTRALHSGAQNRCYKHCGLLRTNAQHVDPAVATHTSPSWRFWKKLLHKEKKKISRDAQKSKDSSPPSLNCKIGEIIRWGNQKRCIQDI